MVPNTRISALTAKGITTMLGKHSANDANHAALLSTRPVMP
jgi:hypothetical protein